MLKNICYFILIFQFTACTKDFSPKQRVLANLADSISCEHYTINFDESTSFNGIDVWQLESNSCFLALKDSNHIIFTANLIDFKNSPYLIQWDKLKRIMRAQGGVRNFDKWNIERFDQLSFLSCYGVDEGEYTKTVDQIIFLLPIGKRGLMFTYQFLSSDSKERDLKLGKVKYYMNRIKIKKVHHPMGNGPYKKN